MFIMSFYYSFPSCSILVYSFFFWGGGGREGKGVGECIFDHLATIGCFILSLGIMEAGCVSVTAILIMILFL